jgi:hypothetical protein
MPFTLVRSLLPRSVPFDDWQIFQLFALFLSQSPLFFNRRTEEEEQLNYYYLMHSRLKCGQTRK